MIPFEQADVRAEPLGAEAVDEPPRHGGADERDRHRQEDQRLGDGLAAAQPVGQRGEREPDVTATSGTRTIHPSVLRIARSMLSSVNTNL